MAFHIVLNRPVDLSDIARRAEAGLNPGHSMAALASELNAEVHDGAGLTPDWLDKALGAVSRMKPLWWAIARKLSRDVRPGDVIFCTGEDVGGPVALLCGRRRGVAVTMTVHRIDSPKKQLALRLFQMRRTVRMFFAVSQAQVQILEQFLGEERNKARFIWDQTDTNFFSSEGKSGEIPARPVILSVGLEQRDYSTVAEATADLEVDVRISGFSADTRTIARALPAQLPANMTQQFYPWPELQTLYATADIAVVSLFPNDYAAGVQGVMEALSAGKPLVVTGTNGLDGYLDRPDAMRVVPTGDSAAMRAAIVELIGEPALRQRMGQAGIALAHERHSTAQYVATLAGHLRALAA